MKTRHFLSIDDLNKKEFIQVLKLAQHLKENPYQPKRLTGNSMAMIFEKPSLRTRVSFEVAMTQLGGHAIYLAPTDIGLGIREPIKDVARVLSRMVDIIMARTYKHETIKELARFSEVPVINALSDLEHPCQILADFLTILEKKKRFNRLKLAFVGDGNNNVTHSLALASAKLKIDFKVASPKGYWMRSEISRKTETLETTDPKEAVKGCDVVYTDTWISMGSEKEKKERLKVFRNYQVTKLLMKLAKRDAIFMHDMPAYRGSEVVEGVIDGSRSVVIDQAENRLHAQKALICFLLNRPL